MQNPELKPPGMNEGFNLSAHINEAMTNGSDPLPLPVSADAARRVGIRLNYDKLTGLMNKDAFLMSLGQTIQEMQPGDRVFVTEADMNGFKAVNDTLLHEAGDELLAIVGGVFRDVYKRETDVVAHGSRTDQDVDNISRLSGDEFASFSVTRGEETNLHRENDADSEAKIQKDRMNQMLEERLAGTKFEPFKISLSLGGAEVKTGDKPAEVLAKADLAMFSDKYQGKIESVSKEDCQLLRQIIPVLKRLGTRIEPWIILASEKYMEEE